MKRREPVITQEELDAAIEEARRDFGFVADQRPDGAYTMAEWAHKIGVGLTTMREKMNRAVGEGRYEKLMSRLENMARPVPLYRKKAESKLQAAGKVYRLAVKK